MAIAIPVFTSQLEKFREATDLANIRAAYAEIMVDAIEDNTAADKEVTLKQREAGWKTPDAQNTLESIFGGTANVTGSPTDTGGTATLTWVLGTSTTDGHCTINIE